MEETAGSKQESWSSGRRDVPFVAVDLFRTVRIRSLEGNKHSKSSSSPAKGSVHCCVFKFFLQGQIIPTSVRHTSRVNDGLRITYFQKDEPFRLVNYDNLSSNMVCKGVAFDSSIYIKSFILFVGRPASQPERPHNSI